MFSCEFCEIFKDTFFYKTPPDDCFGSSRSCQSEYNIASHHMAYYKLIVVNVKITFAYNFIETFLEKSSNSKRSSSKLQNSLDHTSKFYVGISSIVSRIVAPIFRLIVTFMLNDGLEAANGGVLLKKCFWKFLKIHRKRPQPATPLKLRR